MSSLIETDTTQAELDLLEPQGACTAGTPAERLAALTRSRRLLQRELHQARKHIRYVLEEAGLTLPHVVANLAGVAVTEILEAIGNGEKNVKRLAAIARGRIKIPTSKLRASLRGHISEQHRLVIAFELGEASTLQHRIRRIEQLTAVEFSRVCAAVPRTPYVRPQLPQRVGLEQPHADQQNTTLLPLATLHPVFLAQPVLSLS